jgi:hypothetical protein
MGTIWVKEFPGGLDARRLAETTGGGSLIKAVDAHITRGGEVEKRAAFVKAYDLPAGTVGLAANATGLVVFGKAASPTMPSGVAYERLDNGGAENLAYVPAWDLYDGRIYAVGEYVDGTLSHFYDETLVSDWYDGKARYSFDVIGGTGGGTLDTLTVGGISVISGAVSWNTDTDTTADDIAADINSHVSTPEYNAVANGNRVTIIADIDGTAANGLEVVATVTDVSLSALTGEMAGGATASTTFQPGAFVKTLGRKMFALSGTLVHFSGLDDPESFNTDSVGAGFVDMSKEARLEDDLTALATYNQYVAIFERRTVLVYFFDPDPALTRKSQILLNTGTEYPRSVTQFGDADVFYLDTTGLRSLRARDSSSAAATSDIGIPIDELVRADIEALTGDDTRRVFGVIEPKDARFWLIIKNKIYVFSYFPGSKVSAWTLYLPGFDVDEVVAWRGKVYLRTGDAIYVYGGAEASLTYDATSAKAWLPYLNADKPTDDKRWTGVDAAVRGTWNISFGFDPLNEHYSDIIATVAETSYDAKRLSTLGRSTHVSVRFESTGEGYAKLGAAVIHYEDINGETED